MSWVQLTSVTATSGSKVVAINSSDAIGIKVGDALLIAGFDLAEIEGVFASQLQLRKPWSHATQSSVHAVVVPTFGDFNNAVEEIRKLRAATTSNLEALEAWGTQTGTVVFKGEDGEEHTARTLQQMDADVAEIEERANQLFTDISAFGYARSQADMEAERAANKALYAASGFVHMGKHTTVSSATSVNEGMLTIVGEGWQNKFGLGRNTDAMGTSETNHAVFHAAGITFDLIGVSDVASTPFVVKLPEAPKGTEVYDSATGILTNYETDIDPKYGNVAADTNEAVARAFEGMVKNGNGRLGNSEFSVRDCSYSALPNGQGFTVTPNVATQYFEQPITCVVGAKYKAKAVFSISTDVKGTPSSPFCALTVLNSNKTASIENSQLDAGEANKVYTFDLVFTATESIHFISCFFNMPTGVGATATVNFVSADLDTKEVVTHPVDLVGFEVFLREINELDPIIYPYGMQQSKLTTVDGIPTVENTFRPITHFEVFKGDETSRGRGWNALNGSLTDTQLTKVFQNAKHKVFRLSDGRLVQWTLSQRTIRGAGNGDYWYNPATPASTIPLWFDAAGNRCVSVRGALDSVEPFVASSGNWYQGWNAADSVKGIPELSHLGAFIPRRSATNVAVNGECYFYVVATVPRLNQGAYHLSFNPFGAAKFVGNSSWTSVAPQSTKDCFINRFDGYLASGNSGRPDGKFYDAIYDGGLNGIIDWRTSAWDAGSKEEAAKVTQKIISGTYRGLEKLVWTKVVTEPQTYTPTATAVRIPLGDSSIMNAGDTVSVYDADTGELLVTNQVISSVGTDASLTADFVSWSANTPRQTFIREAKEYYIILTGSKKYNISTSGNFLQTDIIGNPITILNTPQLANGWLGRWNPEFVSANPQLSRKAVVTTLLGPRLSTTNLGETWTTTSGISVSELPNTVYRGFSAGAANGVGVINYQAFAKQTKPSVNKSILNVNVGLGEIWEYSYFDHRYGSLLAESLLEKICTNSTSATYKFGYQSLLSYVIEPATNRLHASLLPEHSLLRLSAPNNDSPGVKALTYQISDNQQCSLAFAFNELSHNGTDWGDDSTIKIASYITTYTNLNGDVLLCGTAELAIPYGYTKNKARVGEQTAGVDL